MGTTLSNQAGITLNGIWQLPEANSIGTIQNKASGANGYLSTNGSTLAGSSVEEVALDADDKGQKWERSDEDESGYFTLMNPDSEKILSTGDSPQNTLIIRGNDSHGKNQQN